MSSFRVVGNSQPMTTLPGLVEATHQRRQQATGWPLGAHSIRHETWPGISAPISRMGGNDKGWVRVAAGGGSTCDTAGDQAEGWEILLASPWKQRQTHKSREQGITTG